MYVNYDDVLLQLREAGLEVELPLVVGGIRSERCRVKGFDREKRGWYWLHELLLDDGLYLVGTYGVFQGDESGTQKISLSKRCQVCGTVVPMRTRKCSKCGSTDLKKRELTPEQKAAEKRRRDENARQMKAQRKAEADKAAAWAHAAWIHCVDAEPRGHEYLVRKQLGATGGARILEGIDDVVLDGADDDDYRYLATFAGALVVPMCDITTGNVRGLQFILSREQHKDLIARLGRDKAFWPRGMQNDGLAFMIGGAMFDIGLVCEGYATGVSLFEAVGYPVAVVFQANRLQACGVILQKHYRNRVRLVFGADDDWLQKCSQCKQLTPVADTHCQHCGELHGKHNAGVMRASEAALATAGLFVTPEFTDPRPTDRKGPTDFNDLACIEGLNTVRAQIEAVLPQDTGSHAPSARGAATGGAGERLKARISIDEAVSRYCGTYGMGGKVFFDLQERMLVAKDDVLNLLPKHGWDSMKDHPAWRVVRHTEIGFDPTEQDPAILCNMWGGWPTVPESGECQQLLELLEYLCSNETNGIDVYEWVLKWLAYPIQRPGTKMQSAIVIHGPQGTGKSRFFEAYAKIYGTYACVLDQSAIEDQFNADWASKKLFILADEVLARSEMFHTKNRLKKFITGDTIRVNTKQITAHQERNCMNIVFLSNERMPVVLENDDRRHCVIYTPPAMPQSIYDQVNAEIEAGGIAALHDYLLQLDLGDFKPWTPPPMTGSKRELIDLGIGSEERFIADWQSGQLDAPFCPCQSSHLYQVYMRWCRSNGVARPRESNHFIGYLKKLDNWKVEPRKVFTNHNTPTQLVSKRLVIPSDRAFDEASKLHQVDGGCPPGESRTVWMSSGWIRFANALEGDRHG